MIGKASLRTRLALLYAGLAVIVLAISLFTVYQVAHRDALSRLDNSLHGDANQLGRQAEGAEHGNEATSGERFVHARRLLSSGHLLALYENGRCSHRPATHDGSPSRRMPPACSAKENGWPR